MSNLINLGSFNTKNGKTSGLGLASGLDSNAIIDQILASRTKSVKDIQDKIDFNTKKTSAVSTLSTLLDRLRTTAGFLRSPPGVGKEDSDFFKHTISSVSSSTSTPASQYVTVTSQSGATVNSYTLNDVIVAKAQILRKDNFTNASTSVVGNLPVSDNYQVSLGTVAGTVLNTTTPITFTNDINSASALQDYTTATPATLDFIFSSDNQFNATDNIIFGATSITFGGSGGNDIDISAATTLDQKIDAIVTRMSTIATGDESFYTYSRPSTGVLRITRNTTGTIATAGHDLTVSADFSKGSDTSQKVGIGKIYTNNGSSAGSVALSNSAVSGSVSVNGIDGVVAGAKATINVQFGAENLIDNNDTLTIGTTVLNFDNASAVDVGDTLGTLNDTTLLQKITHIANFMNSKTIGAEAGYSFTTDGIDTLIITRDKYGTNASVGTNLALDADFSAGVDNTQTIKFGSAAASNNPAATTLNVSGADGVNNTSISNAKTTHISTLSGALTFPNPPVFNAGSATAASFTPNSVTFKATVGGVTYTSKPVYLDGGSLSGGGGAGYNGLGARIASGTVITFVKDTPTDATSGTKDVNFQLVIGDEANITGVDLATTQTAATTYQTSIGTFLNTTNAITVTQNPAVPVFRPGTFTLGGASISLVEGDTLNTIKAKINAVQSTSGVIADIVQVSDSNYSLILKSIKTGLSNRIVEYGNAEAGDAPVGYIQFGNDNVAFSEQQAASDASFKLDGLTITRSSNVINDVVSKLTFTLLSDTGTDDPTLTVNINYDTNLIKSGVNDFINAYNELKYFISKQNKRDANNVLDKDAVLGDDNILRDVITSIDAQILSVVKGLTTGNVKSLADVGIDTTIFPGDDTTPKTDGVLVLDASKFDAALSSNFDAFHKAFAISFVSDSSNLGVYAISNKVTLTSFKLDIDTSRATADKVRVLDATTNAVLFNMTIDSNGTLITGAAGTALEGLQLIYTGDGTDTITVSSTQGILSKLFNVTDSILKKDTGLIDTTTNSYNNEDKTLKDNIDKENAQIDIERQLLVDKFSNLETVISSANSVLNFLSAQKNAGNSSNN